MNRITSTKKNFQKTKIFLVCNTSMTVCGNISRNLKLTPVWNIKQLLAVIRKEKAINDERLWTENRRSLEILEIYSTVALRS